MGDDSGNRVRADLAGGFVVDQHQLTLGQFGNRFGAGGGHHQGVSAEAVDRTRNVIGGFGRFGGLIAHAKELFGGLPAFIGFVTDPADRFVAILHRFITPAHTGPGRRHKGHNGTNDICRQRRTAFPG